MGRPIVLTAISFAAFGAGLLGAEGGQASASQSGSSIQAFRSFVAKYCAPCHGSASPMGGLNLAGLRTEQDLLASRAAIEKAVARIKARTMPPSGAAQPAQKDRDSLVRAVQAVFAKAPPPRPDPGRPTLRRLNRAEYDNTVRDLFGLPDDFHPAEDFPSDDVGYGFDNIGDVLSVSPLLLEKYLDAAERIVDRVIPISTVKPLTFDLSTLTTDNGIVGEGGIKLFTVGRVFADPTVKEAGSYRIRVLAYGEQAGPEVCKMELRLDGKYLDTFQVKAVGKAQIYELPPVELSAGKHRIAAIFTNDYFNEKDPDPAKRDRNLIVSGVEVFGPLKAQPAPSAAYKRLMIATPSDGDPAPAARAVLSAFLKRALRRPVPAEETEKYVALVSKSVRGKETFEQGIRLAVQAALLSPSFLFRVEIDPPAQSGARNARPLNDWELASRLSYFIWSSMPDGELFALAESGKLKDPATLAAQVARMLRDPRAYSLTVNFASQWLNLRKLDRATPDPDLFPMWSEDLRSSMREETERFFTGVVREDRSVLDFLDANYTYLNGPLAKLYGIQGISGQQFQKVMLTDKRRAGIITQAALLTLTSNPNRTSPVKRGKWVLENLLGEPPPPPPPGIAPLPGDTDKVPTMTVKERLRLHRQNPECGVCHVKMDAIGFGLENFDAVGRWRTKDGPFTVDASERMGDGTLIAGPEGLRGYLLKRKDDFVRTLADRLLTFALGRGMESSDEAAIGKIAARAAKEGYRFSSVVSGVVTSEPFLKRRIN